MGYTTQTVSILLKELVNPLGLCSQQLYLAIWKIILKRCILLPCGTLKLQSLWDLGEFCVHTFFYVVSLVMLYKLLLTFWLFVVLAAIYTSTHLMGCLSINCPSLYQKDENSLLKTMMTFAPFVLMEETFYVVMDAQGLFTKVKFTCVNTKYLSSLQFAVWQICFFFFLVDQFLSFSGSCSLSDANLFPYFLLHC